ncbi:MAG: hypothetical protein LUD78_10125 [Clostridiales bacterium]|nr:hypothetical protein [Clostridiales bacterium]
MQNILSDFGSLVIETRVQRGKYKSDPLSPRFTENHAEEILFEEGYYVSHCYSRDGESFVRMIINRRFDAVFMMSNRYSNEQCNLIVGNGIPIALYKTRHYDELASNIVVVVPDHAEGVTKCAIGMQYLIPGWKLDNKKPCLVR